MFFRTLFEQAAVGIAQIETSTGRLLRVNQRYADIVGCSRAELERLDFQTLTHPDDLAADLDNMRRLVSGEIREFTMEKRYRHKDGHFVWVNLTVSPLWEPGEPPRSYITVVEDITARKRAETALRESEQKFAKAFRCSPDAVTLSELESGRLIEVNAGFQRVFGYSPEEAIGRTTLELDLYRHPADRSKMLHLLRDHGGVQNLEAEGRHKSGAELTLLLSVEQIEISGTPCLLTLARDITERKRAEAALRMANLVIENSPAVLFRWRAAEGWPVAMVSRNVIQFGYTPEELLSGAVPFASMVHPEDLKRVAREVQEYSASGAERFQQEYRLVTKDGAARWVDDRTSVERNIDGQITFYQGIVIDITERKRLELEREEARALFEASIAQSPSGILVASAPDVTIRWANPAALGIRGKTNQPLTGIDVSRHAINWQTFRPDGTPYPSEELPLSRAVLKGEVTRNEEVIIRSAQGEDRWVSVNAAPIRDRAGDVTAGIVVFHDITERKQAEQSLQASERRFAQLIQNSFDAVVILDANGIQRYVSASAERVHGYAPAELVDIPVIEKMIHPDDQAQVEASFRQIIETGEGGAQYRHRRKEGGWVYLEARGINQLHNPDIGGVVVNVRDITERKRAEEEKEKLQAQLMQAQKMESVGQLAGGVAHDFNNMLCAILGHAELAIMKCPPSEPLLDELKAIQKAGHHSAALVRQLLAFARKQTVAPKVLDLNDTVSGMLKMLLRLIGEDIDLVWRPGAGLWPVKLDPSQIDQILANLCVNAQDAIAGVGKITIETENTAFDEAYCAVHPGFACGEYVMLAVSDDGCGMSPEVMDHLFEPFFTTKEVGRGTGLGLATVYGIVKQNEGFINVYSEPDKGTTFKIYLPRFVGDAVESVFESPAETPMGRGETVLVVEDDAAILNLSRAMLERLGYTVVTAGTPGEALRQTEARPSEIELLITDVIMPEMNGRDLLKSIRDIKPGLKCLFTSGYTANVIAHHGVLDMGVNFLEKPFSLKELASKVRQALERD